MSAVRWIFAIGAVGVATVLVVRSRKRTSSSGDSALCDAASSLGIPDALCDAGIPVIEDALDALSEDWMEREAHNVAINGGAKVRIDPAMPRVGAHLKNTYSGGVSALRVAAVYGTIREHTNGCTPFPGSPGWSKCAPGTKSQLPAAAAIAERITPLTGRSWGYGDGQGAKGGDPFSMNDGEQRGQSATSQAQGVPLAPFPLPLPEGSFGRWDRGVPNVVQRGTTGSVGGVLGGLTGSTAGSVASGTGSFHADPER